MKKTLGFLFFFVLIPSILMAASRDSRVQGSGEVTSIDPMYGRVTIKHGPIKGFIANAESEFSVRPSDLLKDIHPRDLVDFTVVDEKGDVCIEKITKTGTAPEKDDTLPLGRVVQDTLVATGEAAKTITSPITPAHDVVSGAVGATTGATDEVLHDASPEVKKKF